jgi:hypothetical protein
VLYPEKSENQKNVVTVSVREQRPVSYKVSNHSSLRYSVHQ